MNSPALELAHDLIVMSITEHLIGRVINVVADKPDGTVPHGKMDSSYMLGFESHGGVPVSRILTAGGRSKAGVIRTGGKVNGGGRSHPQGIGIDPALRRKIVVAHRTDLSEHDRHRCAVGNIPNST